MRILAASALLAFASVASAFAGDAGLCKTFNGNQVEGRLIAQCNTVLQGGNASGLFQVQSGHFCIVQRNQSMEESADEVVTYVGQDWEGVYAGTQTSEDHLLPGASSDPTFAPGAPASYEAVNTFFSLSNGQPTRLYGPGAQLENGNIHANSVATDGIFPNYKKFRTQLDYDAAAGTLTVQFSHVKNGFMGIGGTTELLYSAVLSCR